MTVVELRSRIERIEGRREALAGTVARLDAEVRAIEEERGTLAGCRDLLGRASARSREEIRERIERAATHALRRVMEDESYRLEVRYAERRGRVEADVVLHTSMSSGDPMESNGYGVVDVIGTTLRLVVKSMLGAPGPIIMDEPAKFLDRARQPNYMRMLREFSRRTGTQVIICTHVTEHVEFADKVFEVGIVDGTSHVRDGLRR